MPSFAGGKERALRIKDKIANTITRISASNLLEAFGGIEVGVTDPLLPPSSDTSEPHVDVWVPEDESELSVSPNQLNFLALKRGGFILICRRSAVRVTAMKNGAEEKKLSRECLISTGATAPFPALIAAVLGEDCIQQFADLGYTKLVFQAGDALRYLYEIKPEKTLGVEIEAFDFNREGLTKQMKACIGRAGKSKEGLVICHAGAGTILDAMRMGLPIIVVPNPTLLDNHQEELAQELQRQGYVLKSDVKHLKAAIKKASQQATERHAREELQGRGGIAGVADHIVGYEDDVQAQLD